MISEYRYYQKEADYAIYEELLINKKCIVKMFCGTGKSLLMRRCKIIENKNLIVYTFPSLSLIDQFYIDYLNDYPIENILKISSENESTTDSNKIQGFLNKISNKIICITYQSFKTLLDNLGEIKINVCLFDEAHHAVGETYQKLIFENDICEKQIFFTATPKNANGIIMYDRENSEENMCGKLVYDYSYLRGTNEEYLNPIEIRIDMYTENTNKSVYESIARAILTSGNNRVLTFHSDVNTDRDTSVNNFVNDEEFKNVFKDIQKKEFPKNKIYKKIKMIGLSSSVSGKDRTKILNNFDGTPNNEVIVISSCETIGEGIDTKNANMCVFVDPKSSFVKIIQNIGRIVRKQFGIDKPKSTILIPCWVDKTKYLDCNGDREKCDEVIREDMGKDGNFNGILNVLSALKQEDEDLYDICLHYPDTFSPQEIKSNLEKQGYKILDKIGEGSLIENICYQLDEEKELYYELYEKYEKYETDKEIIMQIAEDKDICIEIHTNSLENPIERYNSECESCNIIRLYKSMDEETEEDIYQPIVKKSGIKKNYDGIVGPNKEKRMNVNIHTNPDVKVLWNITSDLDITKDICSCVIDCEVVDNWYKRFEKLTKFIDENKRKPIIKNENEKSLSYFMSDQLKNFKYKIKSMKNNIKYDLWKDFIEKYKDYFKSIDDIWYENFEEVKTFIDNNKNKPSDSSKDNTEKILGTWISHQQQNYKKKIQSMKDETKYDLFTGFLEKYKEYFKSIDDIWYENFKEVKKFINNNKKRPSNKSKENTEKILGSWIGTQQKNYKKKIQSMKDETKYDLWTKFLENYKKYLKSDDDIWYEKFEEVKTFIDNNKNRPLENSKENSEKILGGWIGKQQQNYKKNEKSMKDKTRYDLWTEFLDKYKEYLKSIDDIWYDKFEELKIFIDNNKKKPYESSKENAEKTLGSWISTQHMNYKTKTNSMKDETKYDLWTEFLENYKEYINLKLEYTKKEKSNEDIWYEKFEELKFFIDKNKQKPNIKNENEKSLSYWMSDRISDYKTKTNSMKYETKYNLWTEFLEEYNEYFKSNDDIWYEKFEELKIFIYNNKKKPSESSKENTEKTLGTWISNQQKNYKKKIQSMKDKIKYDLWTGFLEKYKEYLKSFYDNWYEKFEEVKIFIDNNKKRPSSKSKENTEKKLGSWIQTQQQNYKKKIQSMKDETKYDLWTEFLKEYIDKSETKSTSFSETNSIIEDEEEIVESEIEVKQKSIKSMKLKQPSKTESKESTEQKRQRVKSEISILHQRYKTLKSENLSKEFTIHPELWHKYHEISEANEESFPEDEIPRNRIIQELNKIKTKRSKLVVDMGCGKGQISQYFQNDSRFKFINYDHISSNDTIISCDISKTPLEDDSVEICILSLAMWGSNCKEYIQETNRILESGGKLYIIEPTKRWSEQDENGNIIPEKEGCKLKSFLEENGFQIVEKNIEKFCLFNCIKI
jgi:superfamily II DNA or RNA helicase